MRDRSFCEGQISQSTARNHIRHILNRLDVHSRLEAVAYALAVEPDPELDKYLKFGEWNTMKVRVKEALVETWLNGQKMIELKDEKIGQATGIIALQIHSGGGIKVQWKNLIITEL